MKDESTIPKTVLERWNQRTILTLIKQKTCQYNLIDILSEADRQNIFYIVFKGTILGNLYENSFFRVSSDSDIFVEEADRVKMVNLIVEKGYQIDEEHSKDQFVTNLYNSQTGHLIELHTSLFEKKVKLYFPNREELSNRYGYAKKCFIIAYSMDS